MSLWMSKQPVNKRINTESFLYTPWSEVPRCRSGPGNMGNPGSEGERSDNDTNMDDGYHKGVPRLTLSRNSHLTNEPKLSPAWQVVHSKNAQENLAVMIAMVSHLKLFETITDTLYLAMGKTYQISTRPKPKKLIKQQAISTENQSHFLYSHRVSNLFVNSQQW